MPAANEDAIVPAESAGSSGRGDAKARLAFSVTVLCLVFVPTGIIDTMLGPMLPLLSARWALSDAQAGYLFTAQFIGSMFGVLLSGKLVSWRGFRPVVLAGLVPMGIAPVLLLMVPWTLGFAVMFVCGVGIGFTIPTINVLVAAIGGDRSVQAVNYLNLSWGLGAIACPYLVAGFQRTYQTTSPLWYGMALLLAVLALALPWVAVPAGHGEQDKATGPSDRPRVWRNPVFPALCCLFFLYVATENGVSGWLPSYARRADSGLMLWAAVPAFFWGALLLGRAVGHLLLRFVSDMQALRVHLLVSLLGIAILASLPSVPAIVLGAVVSGLGFSAVFPFYIAFLPRRFGAQAPQAGSFLFAAAALGGAVGPLIVGFASQHFSLRLGFLVPLLGCLAMLAICGWDWEYWKQTDNRASAE